MPYNTTWDPRNAHTPQSFQRIENELAKQWTDSTRDPNAPSNVTSSRSLGTTYSSGSSIRFVNASITLTGAGGSLSSGTSGVNVSVGGSTIGGLSQQAAALSTENRDYVAAFIVPPNTNYTISADETTDPPAISQWAEWDFDAVFTTQGWSLGDTITEAKLNNYADGVNGVNRITNNLDKSNVTSSRNLGTFYDTVEDAFTFVQTGFGVDGQGALIDMRDESSNVTTIANVGSSAAATLSSCMMVPRSHEYRASASGGTPNSYGVLERSYSTPTNIIFAQSDSEASVGTKIRDLDDNAATGIEQSNLTTSTNSIAADTSSSTPSTSNVSFVMAHVTLETGGLGGAGTATIDVNGSEEVEVSEGSDLSERMAMTMLSPGDSWSITQQAGTVTVNNRIEWVLTA